MSGQTFAGPNDPYYLSSRGINSVSFDKLTAPPLAYLDKGILYEMTDGLLYFNGAAIQVDGATTANALATTTLPVDVAASAAPAAGNVLVASSATAAAWQAPSQTFDDATFVVNDSVDPTQQFKLDVGGAASTLTTLTTAPTVNRVVTLPDVTGYAVMDATSGSAAAGKLPVYVADGQIEPSPIFAIDGANYLALTKHSIAGSVLTNSCIVGTDMVGAASGLSQCVAVGRSVAANIDTISNSTLIGYNIIPSNVGVQTVASTVVVGNGYAKLGGFTTAASNVCVGAEVGNAITTASNCVLIGPNVANALTTGTNNVCVGNSSGAALTTATGNVLVGSGSGGQITGSNNICIGPSSGSVATSGSTDIYIGHVGVTAEAATIRVGTAQTKAFVAGIRGITTVNADAIPVLIDSAGQLGTVSSSIKYKENVADLDGSEVIYKLRAVKFNYKTQPDHVSIGLIAEEVEEVDPSLCIYQPVTKLVPVHGHPDHLDDEGWTEVSDGKLLDPEKDIIDHGLDRDHDLDQNIADVDLSASVILDRDHDEDHDGDHDLDHDPDHDPDLSASVLMEEIVEKELLTVDYNRLSILMLREIQKLKKNIQSLQALHL